MHYLIKSFIFALRGIWLLLRTEINARIHLLATILVVFAGFLFNITPFEWAILVIFITMVWIAEGMNTAIEIISNRINPDYDDLIKKAKDVSAGAVLIAAIGAVIIGMIIFFPYL